MKTRRGNLGSALSSYSDEQHIGPKKDQQESSQSPASAAATVPQAAGSGGGGGGVVSDDPSAAGDSQMMAIDFRSRSDTIGSLGLTTLDDFRGRSETLGSAADVLADCLGPFPSVLDVNVHALPPDQRQVYSAHQAQLEMKLQQQQQQQQQLQQEAKGNAEGVPIPTQIGNNKSTAATDGSGSRPSSHGSTSGFLSNNFGSASKKAAAASASTQQQQQQQQAGGVAHTPPSALGPASYEVKHFGKRMRAGSISGRLRSASDLEDQGIIDRSQKGIIKDLIISGDDALQTALDRYEQGDKSQLESMIKSGRLQSYQSSKGGGTGSNIDILGDLDLDFLTVGGDDLGGIIGNMEMDDAHPGTAGSSGAGGVASHPAGPSDGIGELDFNADYAQTEEDLHLLAAADAAAADSRQRPLTVQAPPQGINEGRWRANSLAFGGLLNETPPQTPGTYANWMDNPNAVSGLTANGEGTTIDANGNVIIIGGNADGAAGTAKLTKKQERELKKAAREKAKQEKKDKKERELREKKARKEEKARRRSMSPKRKKDEKPRRRSMSPKSKNSSMAVVADAPKEPTPSGLGLPRSMSDPNLRVGLDSDGLLCVQSPEGWIGAYSPDSRKMRIERFLAKRNHRVWTKKVKYDVRKNFADSRLRVKGRFVKKEDELLMRDLMSLT